RNNTLRPSAAPAASTSFLFAAYLGSVGRPRNPIVAFGATSCDDNSKRLGTSSAARKLTPVTLPPGRLRLGTKPSLTGSLPVMNTMGMLAVAALAEIVAQRLPPVTNAAP